MQVDCNCNTKSAHWGYHDESCPYRVALEKAARAKALDELAELDADHLDDISVADIG